MPLKGKISTDPISIADGATVTLDGVNINGDGNWDSGDYAGITCLGDATIILKDGSTNTVKGFYEDYPGILVPEGKMLTIKGETEGNGSLTASSDGFTTPESSEPEPEAPAVTPTENKNEWTFTMPDYAIVARVEYDTELALNEVEDNAAILEEWDGCEANITLTCSLTAGTSPCRRVCA